MQVVDFNQFGSAKPPQTGDDQHCAQCEAMLADMLDGTLSATDQAAFDLHLSICANCSAMLADAQRGQAWLEMLRSPRPEPSADLLERILAQTCNAQTFDVQTGGVQTLKQPHLVIGKQRSAHPMWQPSTLLSHPVPASRSALQSEQGYASATVLPFRSRIASSFRLRSIGQTLLQPRLAMTAAMAFFSIALTLNLTGVRLGDLRASDLRPSSIKRNFYQANAHVLQYYDNLKVVYELESRVRDFQRSSTSDDAYRLPSNQNAPAVQQDQQPAGQRDKAAPATKQPDTQNPDNKQSRPKPGPGSSRRETSRGNVQFADFDSQKRPDSLPATQAFVVFTPSVLKYLQEGDLV